MKNGQDFEENIKNNFVHGFFQEPNNLLFTEEREDSKLKKSKEEAITTLSDTIIIPLLRKFIYHLKKSTEFFRFKSINENGFFLINDNSYFPYENRKISQVFYHFTSFFFPNSFTKVQKRVFQEICSFFPKTDSWLFCPNSCFPSI